MTAAMRAESKNYYVYTMANKRKGILYTGVANDLIRRVNEHRNDFFVSFTKRYHVHSLVYFEETNDINPPLNWENKLKKCRRKADLQHVDGGTGLPRPQ